MGGAKEEVCVPEATHHWLLCARQAGYTTAPKFCQVPLVKQTHVMLPMRLSSLMRTIWELESNVISYSAFRDEYFLLATLTRPPLKLYTCPRATTMRQERQCATNLSVCACAAGKRFKRTR